jgi:hypothetical protein
VKLPFPKRKVGIITTLDYAESQRQALGLAEMDSYKEGGELPRFVGQIAGNILGDARQCFDQLGRDLIEGHLLPVAKPKFIRDYESGEMSTYFPLYESMLLQPKKVFHQFKSANRAIYDELHSLIMAMDKNLSISNTRHRVAMVRVIAAMVNEKKHDTVLEYRADPDEKSFVEGEGGSFLFAKGFKNDHPNVRIMLPVAAIPRPVAAYRFACNGLDVSDVCLFAVHGTQMIMDIFYDRFFEATEKVFKPEPPPTITVSSTPPPGLV